MGTEVDVPCYMTIKAFSPALRPLAYGYELSEDEKAALEAIIQVDYPLVQIPRGEVVELHAWDISDTSSDGSV